MQRKHQLTFGSLSRLCLKYCSDEILTPVYDENTQITEDHEKIKTQFNVMTNIFTAIYGTNDIYFIAPQDKGYRNKLLHEKISIPDYMSKYVIQTDQSKKMIEKYIVPYLEEKEYFVKDLLTMIKNMAESREKYQLKVYESAEEDEIKEIINDEDKITEMIFDCLKVSLKMENNYNKKENRDKFFNLDSDDPHGKNNKTSCSTVIQIHLTIEEESTYVFYDFTKCIDFIAEKNLKINSVNCVYPEIFVDAEYPKTSLVLRRLKKDDYKKAYELIKRYNSEFKPKISWRGRPLYEMAIEGLEREIWSGWAYFDEKDEPVAYVDEKIRADAAVEIGIEIVDPEYRKQHLASSLLFLLKLEHPMCIFYGGTFEENESMIATFLTAGYAPNMSFEDEKGKPTNKLRERVNFEHEKDYKYYTNSVYYKSDALYDTYKDSEVK